ncbi:MAG: hypothetical protein AB1505_18695, partial [Candidatus Latescibacterota bacterium]
MRAFRGCLILAFVAASVCVVSAHEPVGVTYYAFQFPLNAVPTIDGDLSDWEVVPRDVFEISLENGDIAETVRGDAGNDLSDFNARNMVAWNEQTNRVYSFADVVDENLNNNRDDPTRYNYDDDWHFVIDADHSGGDMYGDGWDQLPQEENRELYYTTGQLYQIHVPPIDGYWAFMYIEPTNWLTTGLDLPYPEYLQIGWNRTGETGGPGTYQYEIMATPWLRWDWDGPDQSTILNLEEGKIIHIGFLYKDYDLNDGRYDGSYDFPPVHNVWRNASLMADVELLPV